jgi:hypothetical protein
MDAHDVSGLVHFLHNGQRLEETLPDDRGKDMTPKLYGMEEGWSYDIEAVHVDVSYPDPFHL